MKLLWKYIVLFLFIFACSMVAIRLNHREPPIPEVAKSIPVPAAKPQPALYKTRTGTAEDPLQSWERLLAEDGSPTEDRAALADVVQNYLEAIPSDQRPPLGTNEEITRALSDGDDLGKSAIPTTHPAIIHGELVDRWGSPWNFHQLSANVIEVRGAGPDRKLFTGDDIVR